MSVMNVWMILCVTSAVVNDGFAGLATDKQGPYDIRIKFIEDCSDNDEVLFKFYPKMQRVNRTTLVVNGYIDLKVPIDNNVKWTFQLDQKTSQGYKDKFFYTDFKGKGICESLREYGDENDFIRLFGSIKNEDGPFTDCPIPAGKHKFERDVMVDAFKKIPMFFYNTYRSHVKLYRDLNNPPDGCLMIIGEMIPKRKKTSG